MVLLSNQNILPPRDKNIYMELTLILISGISCFVNSVDPDQLASKKSADQDAHCFPLCKQIHANKWNPASYFGKIGEGCFILK